MDIVRITDGSEREEAVWRLLRLELPAAGRGTARIDAGAVQYGAMLYGAMIAHVDRPLLWLEGDKLPLWPQISALRGCHHGWCACSYSIFPDKTGLPDVRWVHRGRDGAWGQMDDARAERIGLGCVLFSPTLRALARRERPAWSGSPFRADLDAQVSDWAAAFVGPCHLHWPGVAHVDGPHWRTWLQQAAAIIDKPPLWA